MAAWAAAYFWNKARFLRRKKDMDLGRGISNVNQHRACESGVLFGILIIIFCWLELEAASRRSRACYFLLLTKKIRTGISFGENEMKNVNDAPKDGG